MQPQLAQDYYELFGLPLAYDVDIKALAERYRDLQQSIHPDRFAHASDQERRLSVQLAAHINEAYQTLKSPILRARYLLEKNGIAAEQQAPLLGNSFLMQQIELREQLEEIQSQSDPLAALMTLREELDQQLHGFQQQFAALFKQSGDDNLAQAHGEFNKMQFIQRVQQEIDVIEERLLG